MTILAAVTGERAPDRVLAVAADLADAYEDDLVVLSVLTQEELRKRARARPEGYTVEDGQDDARRSAERVVRATIDDPTEATVRGRVGDVATEVLAEVDRVDARYLVVGGRRRSPVGKALFGSTSQAILHDASLPVVTVRVEDA